MSLLGLCWMACGPGLDGRGGGAGVGADRPTADFVALAVEDGIEATVVVAASGQRSVRLVGEDPWVAQVRTEVEGGRTLRVYLPEPHSPGEGPVNPVRVEVTVPRLEALSRSGGGTVDVSGALTAPSFALSTSGGGAVRLRGLATEALLLSASGGGEVTLEGASTRVESALSGGVRLEARGFSVRDATLRSGGGGVTTMQVTEVLRVSASGGGEVRITGRPTVLSRDLSGGSTLSFE